jgi:3-oxoadipate enol-lactonase
LSSVPACSERGRGARTLVFLHGIGADRHAFDGDLEHFGVAARAIAWDMPGYGESTPLETMTIAALADSLGRLLDARGVERAILVGHSMGGMVAQEFVAARPERVAALVLVATSPAFGDGSGEWQRRFLVDRLKPLDEGKKPADFAPALVRSMVGPDADERGIATAIGCMSRVPVPTYRAALHAIVAFDRRATLGAIHSPTLVLAAELDKVAPPRVMERMAQSIPRAVYRVIAGAGHLVNLERPREFRAAIDEFLAALSA